MSWLDKTLYLKHNIEMCRIKIKNIEELPGACSTIMQSFISIAPYLCNSFNFKAPNRGLSKFITYILYCILFDMPHANIILAHMYVLFHRTCGDSLNREITFHVCDNCSTSINKAKTYLHILYKTN